MENKQVDMNYVMMTNQWKFHIFLTLLLFFNANSFTFAQGSSELPGNVAILLFDGVQIIDYTIPYEVLSFSYNVFTVTEKTDTVTTWRDMNVIPTYNFHNCPEADILIIPGGDTHKALQNETLIDWIKEKSKTAKIVMSVCNGASFLAKAGLLDNLEVTTTSDLIDNLKLKAPTAQVVRNKRFVDNGKIITTAGFSSGLDGSLHIISREFSPTWATIIARRLEYDWNTDSQYAAGSLADCNAYKVFKLYLLNKLKGEPKLYKGDREHWESETEIRTEMSQASLISSMNDFITTEEKWNLIATDISECKSTWAFTGKDGKNWVGLTKVISSPIDGLFKVSIIIEKKESN